MRGSLAVFLKDTREFVDSWRAVVLALIVPPLFVSLSATGISSTIEMTMEPGVASLSPVASVTVMVIVSLSGLISPWPLWVSGADSV